MNSEELRKACEMAGLEWDAHGFTSEHGWVAHASYQRSDGSKITPIYHPDDPALKPYVAELLVAKVRERGEEDQYDMCAAIARMGGGLEFYGELATAEQRIRAAMAVLGGGDV